MFGLLLHGLPRLLHEPEPNLIQYRGEGQGYRVAELEGAHLDRHERYRAVEESDNVQEAARDFFGNDDGGVLVLWISLPLDVAVLDSPDDVRLISPAELDLDFVPSVGVCLLQQEIQPTSA